MKRLVSVILAVLTLLPILASADAYVKGYHRKDGTYVQPHYRSSPDRSYNNNWSVSPNVNPYTGQQGTRQPTWNDRAPQKNLYGNPNYNQQRR